jgi:hypothetical protein
MGHLAPTIPDKLVTIPARLDARQTAEMLGFSAHDVPVLVARRLLKPLGKPVASATKYFAACEIQKLAFDSLWLNKATQTVYEYWQGKNARKAVNASAHNAPISFAEKSTAVL